MTNRGSHGDKRPSGFRRALSAAVLTGLVLAACSSTTNDAKSSSTPPGTKNSLASSPTSPANGSPTTAPTLDTAPNGATAPDVTLAGALRAKEAVTALKAMFTVAGVDPEGTQPQSTFRKISVCPLGQSAQLTAVPSAPVPKLDTKTGYTLERTRDPEPAVRCTFSDDLPADVQHSIPANRTSSFLEYQVTYVPGTQLKAYLSSLDGQGFERVPGTTLGGAIYKYCAEPDTTPVAGLENFGDCAAIWLNSVIVVALRFSGPHGKSVDVTSWLAVMIEPILDSLASTDPVSIGGPTPASTP